MYKRKTVDEYQIHGLYAHGWEGVRCETSRADAKTRLREYRENEPGTPFKIIKKRVKP